MAIKGDEYVKYMTEQLMAYMDTPRTERKQARTSAKARREPWLTRWFGWGPVSLMLWWRGKRLSSKIEAPELNEQQ
ncbi:hypothetical protein D3C78_1273500 [compost metagenome]